MQWCVASCVCLDSPSCFSSSDRRAIDPGRRQVSHGLAAPLLAIVPDLLPEQAGADPDSDLRQHHPVGAASCRLNAQKKTKARGAHALAKGVGFRIGARATQTQPDPEAGHHAGIQAFWCFSRVLRWTQ